VTAKEIEERLRVLLSNQLGTYTDNAGPKGSAIFVGEPPSDYKAAGLEVRIEPIAEIDARPVHRGVAVGIERQVRLIPHGSDPALPGKTEAAVRRVITAFDATNPRTVPQNENLGILQQYTLLIRS